MSKPKILVQLDPDTHASVFDAVVAVDAGVDQLLQYDGVEKEQVRDLVHGAMFTRGVADLKHTAVFVGGSNVAAGEALLEAVTKSFFGPMRVSVMMDANGEKFAEPTRKTCGTGEDKPTERETEPGGYRP